jgi:transposase
MGGGIFLRTTEQVELAIIEDFRAGRVTREEAARLLGVTPRSVTRWAKAVRLAGPCGIKHGNCGKKPVNGIAEAERLRVVELAAGRYRHFNLRHLHEQLVREHGVTVSYDTVRTWCNAAGIGRRRKRRANRARLYRERLANEGLMLQMDGSHHRWYGGRESCLIAAIDDATSHIPAAGFFPGETTWACFHVLRSIIETRGLPEILYVDGAGWSGGGAKRAHFSQFVRACRQLGVRVVHAHSAQAKGRIERAFRTLQDRLCAELALHDIKSDAGANHYLTQVFLPGYWNKELTVAPRETASRYRPLPPTVDLDVVLSMQAERLVGSAHTASYDGRLYRIVNPELGSLRGKRVTVSVNEASDVRWYYGSVQLNAAEVVRPTRRWTRRAG